MEGSPESCMSMLQLERIKGSSVTPTSLSLAIKDNSIWEKYEALKTMDEGPRHRTNYWCFFCSYTNVKRRKLCQYAPHLTMQILMRPNDRIT